MNAIDFLKNDMDIKDIRQHLLDKKDESNTIELEGYQVSYLIDGADLYLHLITDKPDPHNDDHNRYEIERLINYMKQEGYFDSIVKCDDSKYYVIFEYQSKSLLANNSKELFNPEFIPAPLRAFGYAFMIIAVVWIILECLGII